MNTPDAGRTPVSQPFPAPETFQPDLGAPRRTIPWWLWVYTALVIASAAWLQRPEAADPAQGKEAAAGLGTIEPPDASAYILIAKTLLAAKELQGGQASGGPLDLTTIPVSFSDQLAGWIGRNRTLPPSKANPPKPRKNPEPANQRLHAAIVAAEALPPEEIEWRLDDVAATLAPGSPLVQDVETVRRIYGVPPLDAGPVDAAAADALRKRHGWFADLALSRDDPGATFRVRARDEGGLVIVLAALYGLFACGAALVGFGLLIAAAVRRFSGRRRVGDFWRFRRPDPRTEWPADAGPSGTGPARGGRPGAVWLETVAVFASGFLALQLLHDWVGGKFAGASWPQMAALCAQALLALTMFWPLLRGMDRGRWRREVGWHSGRGVAVEMLAGVAGYCAGLVLLFSVALVLLMVSALWSAISDSEPEPLGGNKAIDLVAGGSPLMVVLLFLMATVWAPIVEETIFRGSLFRVLRGRMPMLLAGLGTAFAFAVLHGYAVQGLVIVGTLGLWFAVLREWRGSLIAPMTAHFIQNCIALVMMIIFAHLSRP